MASDRYSWRQWCSITAGLFHIHSATLESYFGKVWAARLQFTVSLKYPGCHQVFQITRCCSGSREKQAPANVRRGRHLQTLGTKWNETKWNTRAGPLSFYQRCTAQTAALHSILKLPLLSVLFGTTLAEGGWRNTARFSPALEIGEWKNTHEQLPPNQNNHDDDKQSMRFFLFFFFHSHVLFFLFWYFVTMSCKLERTERGTRERKRETEEVRYTNNSVKRGQNEITVNK